MKPFFYCGEVLGEQQFEPFKAPRCQLSSLLGGGGGGSLQASASNSGPALASGGGGITVNNGSNGPMSLNKIMIIAGAGLLALLLFGMLFFHGRRN
jgi:hypothetical protein